jgi:hypothetical protein
MQNNSKIYIELDRDEVITKAIDLMATATDGALVPKGFWTDTLKTQARTHVESDWPKDRLTEFLADHAFELVATTLTMQTLEGVLEGMKQ